MALNGLKIARIFIGCKQRLKIMAINFSPDIFSDKDKLKEYVTLINETPATQLDRLEDFLNKHREAFVGRAENERRYRNSDCSSPAAREAITNNYHSNIGYYNSLCKSPQQLKEILNKEFEEEQRKKEQEEEFAKRRENLTQQDLEHIEAWYKNKLNTLESTELKFFWPNYSQETREYREYKNTGQAEYFETGTRPLSDMSAKERGVMAAAEMLNKGGYIPDEDFEEIKHLFAFNGGKHGETSVYDDDILNEPPKCQGSHIGFAKAMEYIQAFLAEEKNDMLTNYIKRQFIKGNKLMDLPQCESSKVLSINSHDTNLLLGKVKGQHVFYHGDKGILTLAPQGSGKTLCGIIPNLKRFKGSAIVLDVKGECYDKTAHIRKDFGRVLVFDLDEPKTSQSYNPLSHLSRDPFDLWRDAGYMANLLIPPSKKGYNQWDDMAKKYIRLVVAYVLIQYENPSMDEVFDLTAGDDIKHMLSRIMADKGQEKQKYLKSMHGVAKKYWQLYRSSETGGSDAQWQGLLSTANDALEQWNDEYVRHITTNNDWQPQDLREVGTTLYIRVSEETITAYKSVIRAVIGQHMKALQRRGQQEEFEKSKSSIVFFLDEFTQLGEIDEFPKALETGRSRGLLLWLVTQSFQQMRSAYPNSYETLHDLSGVEIYTQPNDKDARYISKRLGAQENIMDGKDRPIIEPQDLSGRAYENKLITFVRGEDPIILDKAFDSDIDYSSL